VFDRTTRTLALPDLEIFAALRAEEQRQEDPIELVASENFTLPADALDHPRDGGMLARMRAEVSALVKRYPVFGTSHV
jgi:glycine/serine hydroxymethyltransferase